MPVRVLIVDDSAFFRRQISKIIDADPRLEVAGTAFDGADAVKKTLELKPDVITMDIEMPVLDGISATKEIMQKQPTPILMFSSLTTEGAKATLNALDAGAVDYLPKKFEEIAKDSHEAGKQLCDFVYTVGRGRRSALRKPAEPKAPSAAAPAKPAPPPPTPAASSRRAAKAELVAIGTSTGGPMALQNVLTKLPGTFPVPIIMVQHMPGTFTPAFAQRLNDLCAIGVKEAEDGDVLKAGHAYLAPGGKQMLVVRRGGQLQLRIQEAEAGQTYKPCVDITFDSLAEAAPGKALAIILTGMGADGREGCRKLKQGGATIWAQDEPSSVVYGMPSAVAEAGLTDRILPLDEVAQNIIRQV